MQLVWRSPSPDTMLQQGLHECTAVPESQLVRRRPPQYVLTKYAKNLPKNPNANSMRKLRWAPHHQHPGSPAPAPAVAGMASASGYDQVKRTPVARVSAIIASAPAQVSVLAPAFLPPAAHVTSKSQTNLVSTPQAQHASTSQAQQASTSQAQQASTSQAQ
jgi:hypothetical protein